MRRCTCCCVRQDHVMDSQGDWGSQVDLSFLEPEDSVVLISDPRDDSSWSRKPLLPVVTQPSSASGLTTSTITTIIRTGGEWSTGLFGICDDKGVCSTLALRTGIRERYKIRGTLCEDWTVVFCCWSCAVCQMARELPQRTATRVYQAESTPFVKDPTA
ncbi:PLAC8-like protein 1 [Ambystoma mexicanum]|uniref:PLAC8-like protein 1 n=1 Tax=Ambystoma mexicanum TaxID=8296 RepID=UPI0037E928C4